MEETSLLLTKAISAGLQASLLSNARNPMLEALLEHYAQFIESQTGVAASDTIAAIKAKAKEKEPELKKMVEETLLKALNT